ncbi:9898_t:CDS:2, partial [Cetraspora pellucida]
KHPWVIADLPNPQKWRDDTDPKKYQALTVTDEEDRLKKKIRKISLSLVGMLRSGKDHDLNQSFESVQVVPSP